MEQLNPYNGFKYLATPYSYKGPDPTKRHEVQEARYREAQRITAKLLNEGVLVFCPIVYCHHIAIVEDLPTDHNFWWNLNTGFIRRSSGILVAKMDGWRQSAGIREEVRYARGLSLRVEYIEP